MRLGCFRPVLALTLAAAWHGVSVSGETYVARCSGQPTQFTFTGQNEVAISCSENQSTNVTDESADAVEVSIKDSVATVKVRDGTTTTNLQFVGVNNAEVNVKVDIKDTDFSKASSLGQLLFDNVNFTDPNVTLKVSDALKSIRIGESNAEDVGLTVSGTSNLNDLQLHDTYKLIPRILYERNYTQILNTDNIIRYTTFNWTDIQALNVTEIATLENNVGNLSTIGLTLVEDCSGSSTSGTHLVCTSDSTTSAASGSGNKTPGAPNLPAAIVNNSTIDSNSSNGTTTEESSGGGSSTTTILIVVIIVAVVVALGLLFVIIRRRRARRAAAADSGDDNMVTLMAKAETPGGGNGNNLKASFISSDEVLAALRVPQSDVSLNKPMGTGRLWVGEYGNVKVLVKRVEAEVTDSFVTKALMNQAHTLATLNHPNIVSMVGVTWLAGTDFAVLAEFMDKGNLGAVVANSDIDLDLSVKLQMCHDVALGLVYLHHRDRNLCMKALSSRKVLVNSAMECKLNLFECVPCAVKMDRTQSFPFGMGEIAWLAPEVLTRSAPMDPRKANVFAFGVLVCQILTRSAPYQSLVEDRGNTLADVEITQRVKRRDVLSPHENRSEFRDAPASIVAVVEACLSYDTMSRPTADELVMAVQRAQDEVRMSTGRSI